LFAVSAQNDGMHPILMQGQQQLAQGHQTLEQGHQQLAQEHAGIQQEILTNRQETQSQFSATNGNVDEQTAHMQLQSGIDQNRQLSEHQFAQMSEQLDRQDKAQQGNMNIESSRESTRSQLSENNHNANMNSQHGMIENNVIDNRAAARQQFQQTQTLQSESESRQAAKQTGEHGVTMAGISENRASTQSQFQSLGQTNSDRENRMTARDMAAEEHHSQDMKQAHDGININIQRNYDSTKHQFTGTNDHISRNQADEQSYRRNHRVITRIRDSDAIARLTALREENELARQRLRNLANRNFKESQYEVRTINPHTRRHVKRLEKRQARGFRNVEGLSRRISKRHNSEHRRVRLESLVRNMSRRQRDLSRHHHQRQEEKERYESIIRHFKNASVHRRKVAARQRNSIVRLRKFIRNLARRQRVLARKIERRGEIKSRHKRQEDLTRRSESRLARGFQQRSQFHAPARHVKSLFNLKEFVRKSQGKAAKRLAKSFSSRFKSLARIVKRYRD
jgi:hypothetical protein